MTIPYPRISPEILHIGPLALRWYGLMYVVGYVVGIRLLRRRVRQGRAPFDERAVDTLVGYLLVGMFVGARLVYVSIYDRAHYLSDPLEAFAVWHGGLSFHGALLGFAVACVVFASRFHVPFARVADAVAFAGTPGLFFGRIGNFINAELYGRPTHVAWAMVFPTDPMRLPRHPSQLYEALCEGVLLFLVLWVLDDRAVRGGWYRPGLLAGAFLTGYGVLRFFIEFTRQPDAQLGFIVRGLSMGQLLCALMCTIGIATLVMLYRRPNAEPAAS